MDYFTDYCWEKQRPLGRGKISFENLKKDQVYYRILQDPYGKKVTIERYLGKLFDLCIYDSQMMNFKKILQKEGKELWYREVIKNDEQGRMVKAIVKDENDQVVAIELFLEKETKILSPHGILIGVERIEEGETLFYDAIGKEVLRTPNYCEISD